MDNALFTKHAQRAPGYLSSSVLTVAGSAGALCFTIGVSIRGEKHTIGRRLEARDIARLIECGVNVEKTVAEELIERIKTGIV